MRWLSRERTLNAVEIEDRGERVLELLFGDRPGLALFLGAMVFYGVFWRIGFFSTDNYAVANAVVALADGHLYIDRIVFGPASGATPGMHVVDGRLYARNYGLVAAAVPVYLVLETVNALADVRIAVISGWCFAVLALGVLLGDREVARRTKIVSWVTLAVLAVFVVNFVLATSLEPAWFPVIALQAVTAMAASMTGVLLYRLVSAITTRRLGIFAGGVLVFASPVGFWATIPKRHSLTVFFAVTAIYGFYRSRAADTAGRELQFRALAYSAVAGAAWLHAAEALALFAALLIIDVLTARSNHPKRLAIIALVFGVALSPFLVTNTAISGDALMPPRELPNYSGDEDVLVEVVEERPADTSAGPMGIEDGESISGESGSDPAGATNPEGPPGKGGSPGSLGLLGVLAGILDGLVANSHLAVAQVNQFSSMTADNLGRLVDPAELADIGLRSGYEATSNLNIKAINLSVLESMPLLGVLIAIPLIGGRKLRSTEASLREVLTVIRPTDGLVLLYGVLITLLYIDRLPLHHMFTVRYLHPLYLVGVYFIVQLPAVRSVVTQKWRAFVPAYVTAVLFGIGSFVFLLHQWMAVQSEAVQLYAMLALGMAVLAGSWTISVSVTGKTKQLGVIVLALVTASMTIYLLVSGLGFFAFTRDFLLPLSGAVAENLRFINPWQSLWDQSAGLYQLTG